MSPSIISTITALAALSATANAMPFWGWGWPTHVSVPNGYQAPLNNGSATLDSFSPSKLKVVTIGKGTQNYTCAADDANVKPVQVGAVATLYNVSPYLAWVKPELGNEILNAVPGAILNVKESLISKFLPKAGVHYFNATGTPVFDMRSNNFGMLKGKKGGAIDAPSDSTHGMFGNAVPWLFLPTVDGSKDLSKGYRTWTAAGAPPANCKGQPKNIEVPYAAQYFFYQ